MKDQCSKSQRNSGRGNVNNTSAFVYFHLSGSYVLKKLSQYLSELSRECSTKTIYGINFSLLNCQMFKYVPLVLEGLPCSGCGLKFLTDFAIKL